MKIHPPRRRRRFPTTAVFLCVLSVFCGAQAFADDPKRIEALVKGGAPHLALSLLERGQPPPEQRQAWLEWERQRLGVLAALHDWDGVARRVDQMPPDLPVEFRRFALLEAAQARLAAADAAGARAYLRRLIWREHGSARELARWRRLVIRSYLQEDNLADAQSALLRYQQDYDARDEVWQILHAEILLRADKPKAAFEMLAGAQSHEARLLRALAALRAGSQRPHEVMAQAERLALELRSKPALQRQARLLQAEAAARAQSLSGRVLALEQALALPEAPVPDRLFAARADDLWSAYDLLAEAIGGALRLPAGNDQAWSAKAGSYARQDRHYARALHAYLTIRGREEPARLTAHQELADSLLQDGGGEALQALYTKSARYPSLYAIPDAVRYRLADKALKDFNIQLAAGLVKDLATPPPGEDAGAWALRRARALVYAGDLSSALALLRVILDGERKVDADLGGRVLQVLFDLQAVGRHDDAVALLEALFKQVDNERMRREILYWQAESRAAAGRQLEAAELYLRSATYPDVTGDDLWGQSARFYAAEALGKAGLVPDARNVYLRLLRSTADPKRRALIERNMQQLWLAEKETTTR
ncbi:MAG: hypothetical protein A2637_06675 [Candidatus Muproteobacteria bacterium RIFCSPHIGHO2_01_FULL_65_16]|uniref:Tetratricopeptide repeat protein n=1 Tax=Candidatus Muproteobacteria bacterium RIFCSPHIGHO2_01_FULL_65_16 TaxID=1817764 RepID=A0A1F6TEY8_9PROT|nr:MAG: hypothetical protein A2637_06675 [Candidatus Muproteobacteria bacterium RIFCSPHIGHO2_01_FULL_65_16]